MCSRTFGDALQRLGRYKQLTCPEEIRIQGTDQESSVEFFYVEARETQPEVLVDMLPSWILSVGRQGTEGQIAPLRLELSRSMVGKRPTLEDAAKELGLGSRTVQRRLTDAGITFQQLVEVTRRELARHYLKQRAVELNETAFLLGFEDANSFCRAFQVWEGTSPGEWRTRAWKE
jgi:AraC-like DNA-binding protein